MKTDWFIVNQCEQEDLWLMGEQYGRPTKTMWPDDTRWSTSPRVNSICLNSLLNFKIAFRDQSKKWLAPVAKFPQRYLRNINSNSNSRSANEIILREPNVRNGEENLNFCCLVSGIVLDWEMFGVFLIWHIAMVVVYSLFLISWCCSSVVFQFLLLKSVWANIVQAVVSMFGNACQHLRLVIWIMEMKSNDWIFRESVMEW